MLTAVQQFIQKKNLFSNEDSLLCACSGGIDSVVLVRALHALGYKNVGIAHCNFHLRGEESDKDEIFVKSLSEELNLPFYVIHFDTATYAKEQKISIEMAARKLRYNWFLELCNTYLYKYILTAHHKNDQAETILLNLSKGAGVKGLRGIQPIRENIRRPFLGLSKHDIFLLAEKNNWTYREDSSNLSLDYERNKIRHQIIPVLESINPALLDAVAHSGTVCNDTHKLIQWFLETQLSEIVFHSEKETTIFYKKITSFSFADLILYEIISPFGFNKYQIEQIKNCLNTKAGKQFYSATHRIVLDRDTLIITQHLLGEKHEFYIDKDLITIDEEDFKLEFRLVYEWEKTTNKNEIFLPLKLVQFPLVLRKWNAGDRFMPMGMKGFKKVQDFFTDIKLSLVEKEQTWILENGNGDIIWIVNYRQDERYKITSEEEILKLTYGLKSKSTA